MFSVKFVVMQMQLFSMHEALSPNYNFKSGTIWQFVHTQMHVNVTGFRQNWYSTTCTVACQCGFFRANMMERLEQFKLKTYFKKHHSDLYQFMCLSQNKIMKQRHCKKSEIICFTLNCSLNCFSVLLFLFLAIPSDRKIVTFCNK